MKYSIYETEDYYGYIYITLDQKYNKVYVGQKKGKIEDSIDYFGSGKIVSNIIKDRGVYFLRKTVLGVCYSKEELTFWETECKYFFNAFDRNYGYNIAIKDNGGDNFTHHPNKERWKRLNSLRGILTRNSISSEDRILLEGMLNNTEDINLLEYDLWREQKRLKKQKEKEYNALPEVKSEKTKNAWKNKSDIEKEDFTNKMIIINNSDEHRQKSRQARQSKEYKQNMSQKMSEYSNREKIKEKRSEDAKKSWEDKNIRKRRQIKLRETYTTTDLSDRHSESMKSEKRKEMDLTVNNFKNNFLIFTIYDISDYYKCSKDIAQGFLNWLLKNRDIYKIGRIKGEGGKIYYEVCKN